MRTTTSLALSSLALVSLFACGGGNAATGGGTTPGGGGKPKDEYAQPAPTKPDSDKVTWKQDAKLASCHNDVKTGADLVAGVSAMAKACASIPKPFHQVGDTVQGARTNMDPAQAIPLKAEAGHCYRVYGLSEDKLQDLDIAVIDSAGKSCGEDGSDSPDSVVLEDGEVCFTAADNVNVNVAAGSGAGKFAVQIWSD